MFSAIFITIFVVIALAVAFRSPQERQLIKPRPYDNRYNAASAARESWLG